MILHSPDDVADLFGVDRRKVIEWTRRYGWPHVKVGRTIAFTNSHLEQIVENHTQPARLPSGMPGQTHLSRLHSLRTQA